MIGPQLTSQGGIASVIASFKEHGLFDKWPVIFLPTHVEGDKLAKLAAVIVSLLQFIPLVLSNKVAALHAHIAIRNSFWRKALFMLIALTARVPYFIHLHAGAFHDFYWKETGAIGKFVIRFLLNRSACLVVLSSQFTHLLKDITTNTSQKVIPNFAHIPEVRHLRDRDAFTLLFLGSLNNEKGLFDLIEAVALLKDDYPLLRLEIGGSNGEKSLWEAVSRKNLEDRIKLNGWITGDAKDALMRRATLFVLPSYYEGLPMCVLESMANDLPVVASDVGGTSDIITSGYNGILIKPGDIPGIASAIRELLAQPEQRRTMAENARNTIIQKFSAPVVIPQIEALYEQFGVMPVRHPNEI